MSRQKIKEDKEIEASILKLILSQGIFAVLFVYVLLYVLKENSTREQNYQKMVDLLTNKLPDIEEKLNELLKK